MHGNKLPSKWIQTVSFIENIIYYTKQIDIVYVFIVVVTFGRAIY